MIRRVWHIYTQSHIAESAEIIHFKLVVSACAHLCVRVCNRNRNRKPHARAPGCTSAEPTCDPCT